MQEIYRAVLALTAEDDRILSVKHESLFNDADVRKTIRTTDEKYVISYWEFQYIDEEVLDELKRDLESVRHSYIEFGDEGVWRDVSTHDAYGEDEEFDEILSYDVFFVVWGTYNNPITKDAVILAESNEQLRKALTFEQRNYIYEAEEHRLRLQDAEENLKEYLEANKIPSDDILHATRKPDEKPVMLVDVVNPKGRFYLLEKMVSLFEKRQDRNVAENDVWRGIISQKLKELEERS